MVVIFTALFSRLWFLQVLASDDFRSLAKDNRVRFIHSEPERGRILDRNAQPLVDNRFSTSITLDRSLLEQPASKSAVLHRLARLLEVKVGSLRKRLADVTVSPYKPIAVANDVPIETVFRIEERQEDFPGVAIARLPVRTYPQGQIAAQTLGYVGEISPNQLDLEYFKRARPRYRTGDIVGKLGLERTYDKWLRGRPGITRVVVNAAGKVVSEAVLQPEEPGRDLITGLDLRIQRLSENALAQGIHAARKARYNAPDGGVVVMDPKTGEVRAMASFPTYDPAILADGITTEEFNSLGQSTATGTDDALLNRPLQAGVPPGSTFKTVTAGAAMSAGLASPHSSLTCPPARTYGSITFNNWTSADYGSMGFARSLEVSCDTFYYELGWRLEQAYGAAGGDGSERFQDYMRASGFGDPTGIDLPFETGGRVPDAKWCLEYRAATDGKGCRFGWLPGYTVNMSIGQGDLIVSPLQMAVSYAALINGGRVLEPRVGAGLGLPQPDGTEKVVRDFKKVVAGKLPLDATEMAVLRRGLEDAVMGPSGTARSAFSGFPLSRFPIAGKTGTAQIGRVDSGLNFAWFVSYAPATDPDYVIAVYLEQAGHGGESAAPIARRIYEGIFGVLNRNDVRLAEDRSG
jgi:penicillin-binding protein 2